MWADFARYALLTYSGFSLITLLALLNIYFMLRTIAILLRVALERKLL